MKVFNCDTCGELIYFENHQCLSCFSTLGYLPEINQLSSLQAIPDSHLWRSMSPSSGGQSYRKCRNYEFNHVCNWMIPEGDPEEFCLSCRLNEIIPDLSVQENILYWHKLEKAKRRLIYSILRLELPLKNKQDDSHHGLAFRFLANDQSPLMLETNNVMISHEQGRITINIAEANDIVRENMRLHMNERYRTLLGHFRHEIGHYYWYVLVEKHTELLFEFQSLFGNENEPYDQALQNYYQTGPKPHWQQSFISAYASSHPWEDWAETFAHYLHMYDTLETARSWGISTEFNKQNRHQKINLSKPAAHFDEMKEHWIYLSSALNSLNRSMGMADIYPFVWSHPVIEKLRFVQKVMNLVKLQRD